MLNGSQSNSKKGYASSIGASINSFLKYIDDWSESQSSFLMFALIRSIVLVPAGFLPLLIYWLLTKL